MRKYISIFPFLLCAFAAANRVEAADQVTVIADRELTFTRRDGDWSEQQTCGGERKKDGVVLYYFRESMNNACMLVASVFDDYRFCGWRGMVEDDTSDDRTSPANCTVLLTTLQTNLEVTAEQIQKAKLSAYHHNEHVVCPKYERTVTIKVDVSPAKAGTVKYTTTDPRYGEDGKTRVGESCTLSAVPTAGYAFEGWKKGTTTVSQETAYAFKVGESSGGTYVAVCTGKVYKVTLDQPAGSPGTPSVQAQYGSPMPGPITLPERYGYTFGGYFAESEGKGEKYYNADGTSAHVWDKSGGATLYAKWIPQNGDLILKFSAGVAKICYRLGQSSVWTTNTTDTTISLQVGTKVSAYGIPFNGWEITDYTKENQWEREVLPDGILFKPTAKEMIPVYTVTFVDPTGANDPVQEEVEEGGSPKKVPQWTRTGYGLGWDKDFSRVTANMTVTAVWTPNPYVIQFNSNGGEGLMDDLVATYDTPIELALNAFTKGILTFQHWTATVDQVAMSFADGETVSNLTSVANGTNTLYAVWGEDYLVGFDGNGATNVKMDQQRFLRGVPQRLDANLYERTGYAFLGWTDTRTPAFYTNREEVVDIGDVGATNTLVAAWSNNPYRVVFDIGGVAIIGDPPAPKTCAFDKPWRLPPAPTPQQSEYGFVGWSYAFDGETVTNEPGATVSNLTSVADQTVTVRAVWKVDFGDFSRALGGDALHLKFVTDDGEEDWYAGEKTPDKVSPSSSYVGKKKTAPSNRLRAEVYQSGTLTFRWKGPENDLTVEQYLDTALVETLAELSDAKDWESVSVHLTIDPTASGITTVALTSDAAEDDGWPIWIADMTWTPDGGGEPTPGDPVEVTAARVEGNMFSLTIPTESGEYGVWTNADLTVDSWGLMGKPRTGDGNPWKVEWTILPEFPQLFFRAHKVEYK